MRRRALALGTAVLLLGLAAPPGGATEGSAVGALCAGSVRWDFSPPLGSGATTGSVTQTFSGVCGLGVVGATTSTTPPSAGEFHNLFGTGPSTLSGGYSGDCQLAIVTIEGMRYTLVGSTLAIGEERDSTFTAMADVGVNRLTPDSSCDVVSASGDWVVASSWVNLN